MASRTALALVKGVMGKLRDERVATLTSTEPTETLLDFVNDAKESVLEDRTWAFDRYDDKQLVFLPQQSGPTTAVPGNTISMTQGIKLGIMTITGTTLSVADFIGPIRTKIQISDSNTPETLYNVRKVVPSGANILTFTLATAYQGGTDGTADWATFCYEALLPTDVRKITWATHQEQPVSLSGANQFFDFDATYPKPSRYASDQPRLYVSGMSIPNTWNTTGAVTEADRTDYGIRIFPVPTSRTVIDYAYVLRHGRLAVDTDTIDNVPDRVIDLIEWKATVLALYSMLQNDPAHARLLDAKIEADIRQVHGGHSPSPNARRAPPAFGSSGVGIDLRRRFLHEEVPEP